METVINLPFITAGQRAQTPDMKLTCARFDDLTAHLVECCRGPVKPPG